MPDFVIIGAQKTSTTWMWRQLRSHPEAYVPPRKEIHFFDKHIMQHGFDWYAAELNANKAEGVLLGEKTPCYAHLDRATAQFMAEVMPNTKFVLVLRDPADRSWSQARMEASKFNSEVAGAGVRGRMMRNLASLRNTARTDYATMLDVWTESVGEARLQVLFYEQLVSDPDAFWRRFCAFIDIDPEYRGEDFDRKVWASRGLECPQELAAWLRLKYRRIYEAVERRYPESLDYWDKPAVISLSPLKRLKYWLALEVAVAPFNACYAVLQRLRVRRRKKRLRQLTLGMR